MAVEVADYEDDNARRMIDALERCSMVSDHQQMNEMVIDMTRRDDLRG